MKEEKKAKFVGVIVTVVVHIVVIFACFLSAFTTPLPLPKEEGVEVMLGSSNGGNGNDYFYDVPYYHKPSQSSDDDALLTSNSGEEIGIVKAKNKITVNNIQSQDNITQQVDPVPVVNPNALYKGNSSNNNGSNGFGGNSTGNGNGDGDGDGGSIFGTEGSQNPFGLGGNGKGISYSLYGRGYVSLPKPQYDSQEQGKIVVSIKVNKQGNVIEAVVGQSGTTITDKKLLDYTRTAALSAKFKPNNEAAEIQIGTITYDFRLITQ